MLVCTKLHGLTSQKPVILTFSENPVSFIIISIFLLDLVNKKICTGIS